LLLAIAAIPIALAFAYAGLQAILRIVPTNTIPDEASVTLNIPVLLGSLGIALATVILVGLAPALHSANPHLAAALNSIRSSGSRTKRRLLSGFVVTEIALSLALLMLAGLMVRSLLKVESVAVPFSPDHTLTMRVPLSDERYSTPDMRIHFFRELLDRASAVPGVNQATVDAVSPFMDMYVARMQLDSQSSEKHLVSIHLTDPAYLGISSRKMLLGHFLDAREISAASHEVVITENFAKRYFSGQNVIGQTIYLPGVSADRDKKTSAGGGQQDDAFTIVGVMSDLPSFIGLGEDYPHIFIPYTVAPSAASVLILSTALPADGLVNPVRQIVYSMDKDQPVIEAMSLRHMLDMYGYAGPRFLVALFGSFAMAALLISLVGIYGVLSFTTSQRTHEIGVRMALGANRAHVMWLVLRQACMLALLGVAMGLPLAFLAAHLAKSELVHTSLYDPLTIVMVVCVLPLLAVAGTYLPARRAAATDPVIALRAE
jgi:putative ABC transport system permease protein